MRFGPILLLLLLASCSTVEHSSASGFINDPDYATVFRNVTSATVSAGFIILATSPDNGTISATRQESGLISEAQPTVEITVRRAIGGVAVQIASTVKHGFGDVLAESDKSSMQGFCNALLVVNTSATCKVQADRKR